MWSRRRSVALWSIFSLITSFSILAYVFLYTAPSEAGGGPKPLQARAMREPRPDRIALFERHAQVALVRESIIRERSRISEARMAPFAGMQKEAAVIENPPVASNAAEIPVQKIISEVMQKSVETKESAALSSQVTSNDKKLLLQGHNAAREAVGITPLSWADGLATGAQEWANTLAKDQCEIRHSNEPYGENIYYVWSSNKNFTSSGSQAVTWWTDEQKYYDYNSNTCDKGKVCGHYTQIVWKNTSAVGCGVARCDLGNKAEDVWVCRYSPRGNISGKKPY